MSKKQNQTAYFGLRLSEDLLNKLRRQAKKESRTLANFIRLHLQSAFDEEPKQEQPTAAEVV